MTSLNAEADQLPSFPPEISHRSSSHTNAPETWKLMETAPSSFSKICKDVNPDECHLCEFILGNTSRGIPSRIYYNIVQNSQSKNLWGGSQRIRWFRCACNECPVQYQIRRLPKFLAIYQLGKHKHPIRTLIGLSVDTKAALIPFINKRDGAGMFIRHISEPQFPSDIKKILLNGINETDNRQMKNFKRQCQNHVRVKKKSRTSNKISNPEIGDNQSDFIQWLDSRLKNPSDLSDPEAAPPKERQNIIVLSQHDSIRSTNDMKTNQIIVTTYEMLSSVKAIGEYFEHHPQGILAEIDYTKGLINDFVVGCVGVSDAHRQFHPILFEINRTENGDGAKTALSICNDLFNTLIPDCQLGIGRVLKDGGSALSSATKFLGHRELSCLAHLIRMGWGVKKGHGSGYMGSLPTYLRSKSCPKLEIKWLTLALIALRHLPSEEEYTHAVHLLRAHCEQKHFQFCKTDTVKSHVFEYYFPLSPRLNFSPMEPRSTNGLEKTLGVTKAGSEEIHKSFHYPSITHAFFNYVATYRTKSFSVEPKEYKHQWDSILSTTSSPSLPLEYLVATLYNFTTNKLVPISTATQKSSYVVYCPSKHHLKACIAIARTNFIKESSNSFTTSMDLDVFRRCCSCNPGALAHLLLVVLKGLCGT